MARKPTDDILLTDKEVRKLGAPARGSRITYDGGPDPARSVKGFGVRVTAAGVKAFILNYRIDGRERRLTIGSFPEFKVGAARRKGMELKRQIADGRDPLAERVARREAPTMAELCDRYLEDHAALQKRERSRREDESLIKQWIKPELGKKKVATVECDDIDALHIKITKAGTPVRANRTATLLSKMFNLAIRWKMRRDNPVKGLKRNTEEPRTRYLSAETGELAHLAEALASHPNEQAANVIRLLLLTGARRGEALSATWMQFDLKGGVWTKPSAHTKTKKEHRVPLSRAVIDMLIAMRTKVEQAADEYNAKRRPGQPKRDPSPYLFPGKGTDVPMVEIKTAWAAIRKAARLDDGVRLHDLRHSYASILASEGLSLPVIGALLGHTQPGTTARYAHLLDDPLRAATERVGAIVTGSNVKGEVVPLKKGA